MSERRKIAKYYINELKNFSKFILPNEEKHCKHSFHLFPLQIKFNKLKINKKELFKKIFKKRYQITSTLYPIHLQPYYKENFYINRKELNNAEEFYKNEVSIPIFPGIKKNQLLKVVNELKLIR